MELTDREFKSPSKEDIAAWMHREFDKDGSVTIVEMIQGMLDYALATKQVIPSRIWREVTTAFHEMDLKGNNNHQVTPDELEAWLNGSDSG